jgi:hypothetical protein
MVKFRYLSEEANRHGTKCWYVRMPGQKKQRIYHPRDSQEFHDAYWRARNHMDVDRPPTKLQKPRRGLVYFVQGGTRMKVGFSDNFVRRLKAIQTGCSYPVIVRLTIKADENLERAIHAKFWRSRTCGEWFKITGSLNRFVDELAINPEKALERRRIAWAPDEIVPPRNEGPPYKKFVGISNA